MEKRKYENNEYKHMHLDFLLHNKLGHSQGVKRFKTMSLIRTEKSATDFLLVRKKNEQIKGLIITM